LIRSGVSFFEVKTVLKPVGGVDLRLWVKLPLDIGKDDGVTGSVESVVYVLRYTVPSSSVDLTAPHQEMQAEATVRLVVTVF
jgi:hypothetical protein